MRILPALAVCCGLAAAAPPPPQQQKPGRMAAGRPVTFYDDVLPLLQKRCMRCHGATGRIAPVALTTYGEVRAAAAGIQEALKQRRMPPWFADPNYGPYTNEPHLSESETRIIDAWIAGGHLAGKMSSQQRAGWTSAEHEEISADLSVSPSQPVSIPPNSSLPNQYFIFELPFTRDRWVKAAELRPSDHSVVQHAILYIRQQQSTWLRKAPGGVPYSPADAAALAEARQINRAEILAVFTPGSPAVIWPEGMGKKLATGADLVLEVHYVNRGAAPTSDQPQIGLALTSEPVTKQVVTMEVAIGDPRLRTANAGYRSAVSMSLPADATVVGLYPYSGLRGIAFDVDIVGRDGSIQPLLKTRPNKLDWQAGYALRNPPTLPQGGALRWTAIAGGAPNTGPAPQDDAVIGYFDVVLNSAGR